MSSNVNKPAMTGTLIHVSLSQEQLDSLLLFFICRLNSRSSKATMQRRKRQLRQRRWRFSAPFVSPRCLIPKLIGSTLKTNIRKSRCQLSLRTLLRSSELRPTPYWQCAMMIMTMPTTTSRPQPAAFVILWRLDSIEASSHIMLFFVT